MPDTIEERLRKLRAQQGGSIEERLAALRAQQQPPAQEPEGAFSSFQTGVAGPLLRNVIETAADFYNAPGETLERIGRAGAPIVAALGRPDAGPAYLRESVAQAGPLAELNRRADERLPEFIQSAKAGMALEEAKPRTRAGRIAGTVGRVLGEVAFPTAPETVVENILAAPVGGAAARGAGAAFKAGVNSVKRVLGKGAAQIIEAELPAAAPSLIRASGPAIDEAAIRASLPNAPLNAAISEAASEIPMSTTKRVLGEISAFPRAMMSSLDISAPGRQGLILSVAPSRWGAAVQAGRRMFQAFRKESYDKITDAIRNDADAPLAEQSGLYLALRGNAEEFFTSQLAAKIPGVQASQRAYETYLDSLRMSTFSQYKKLIDKGGLSADDAAKAYSAAASWINVATGRGSLGKNFDRAVPFFSQVLFAPRFAASRFNILNPAMYIRNFRDPATRVVAKAQMRDLAQYVGAIATTYGLARAAGLDVGLNPDKADFLKIRYGNKTFDPGAGITQVVRFAVRASADLFRASKGEKAEWGKDAGSLTLRFLRSKLAPIPSYAADFFTRRTYVGKPFDKNQAVLGAIQRVTPLTWADFSEALYNEGIGGALATLPGAVGIGAQTITDTGAVLDRMQPVFSEYSRLGRQVPEIRRTGNESTEQFNGRVKLFGQALQQFGVQLVESEPYRNATDEQKKAALNLLPRRISGAFLKQNEQWLLRPDVIMADVRDSQQLRQERR